MNAQNENTTAIRAFLSHIIDFAGLYPPASLSLEDAISNFVRYQSDTEVWILSRFIIPAKRLGELSKLAESIFLSEGGLSFSVLGRGGKDASQFIENLKLDMADIHAFRELHGARVVVEMFEAALPVSVLGDQPGLLELVNKAVDTLNKNGLTVFFEAPWGEGWLERAEKLMRSLRKVKDKHVGFKLRVGGVTADAFPTPEQVAWTLMTARDAGISMKATAGLHHPIRRYDESVQTKMHGFLNVFGAGVLALSHGLDQDQIQAVIEDEDPANFVFSESDFSWKNFTASVEQIEQVRQSGLVSFGSCSFDEPREDLQVLGLL